MLKSFSERQGLFKPTSLSAQEMSLGLQNRLWNSIQEHINEHPPSNRNKIIKYLWDKFFKQDTDTLREFNRYIFLDQIKENFFKFKWNKIYDFLECLLSFNSPHKEIFIENLNIIFTDERSPYKIINNMVIPLISGEEAKEIEQAMDCQHSMASKHIKKALMLYCKRPIADYQNSIKESISAIEAVARIILNSPSATLGDLANQLNIHTAFKEAIKKLYGWTSDEGGIRHSENGKALNVNEAEARYMLIQCSALLNYIISKDIK